VRALWRLEVLAYWQQSPGKDRGEWLPFLRLVAITFALEAVAFLYITGGLRPLSSL
jgi:hypothetical protein